MFNNTPFFSSFSVSDITAAKQFYGETLGLSVNQRPEGLELALMGGARVFIYPSSTNKPADFTILNFLVEDIESVIADLNEKGVTMEQYNMEYLKTDLRGIAHNESGIGPRKMAWFKDPAGNIIGLMQEK